MSITASSIDVRFYTKLATKQPPKGYCCRPLFKNCIHFIEFFNMELYTLKIENNYLNTKTYSYLEISGVQSSNQYLNVVHFFNTSVN